MIPFLFLVGLHVVKGTICCAYTGLPTLATLGVMYYRPSQTPPFLAA